LACYIGNNQTALAGNRGQSNCLSGQCNVGPLWIRRSDESSKRQAAYYCSSNLGLQLGDQLQQQRTTQGKLTSSPVNPTRDQSTESKSDDHRGTKTTLRPVSSTTDRNSGNDDWKRPTIVFNYNHRPVSSDTSSRRRPTFGSQARLPGTAPSNSTQTKP